MAQRDYGSSWPAFLRDFALDSRNFWCPAWIARNYEKENEVLQGLPVDQLVLPPLPAQFTTDEQETGASKPAWPHQDARPYPKFHFEKKSGEPEPREDGEDQENDVEHPNTQAPQDCWDSENRPSWQRHSELGPDLKPEGYSIKQTPLQEVVNPDDFDYSARAVPVDHDAWRKTWDTVAASTSRYEDHALRKECLNDDHQLLFVNIVLGYVERVISSRDGLVGVKPLRIFLLGTAGTGKTRAVRTALQELYRVLDRHGLPVEFVRCAAPTGTAAFNMRFNATTLHRLIHWLNLRHFDEIKTDKPLKKLQEHFQETRLIFLDEVSMLSLIHI